MRAELDLMIGVKFTTLCCVQALNPVFEQGLALCFKSFPASVGLAYKHQAVLALMLFQLYFMLA
jgi:hypothetical protein